MRFSPGTIVLEKLGPLAAQAVFEREKAGDVTARPRQASHNAGADRIDGLRKHD